MYIMTGYGRLRNLGVDIDLLITLKCIDFMDNEIEKYYEKIYYGGEVKPQMGKIQVKKEDKGVPWGLIVSSSHTRIYTEIYPSSLTENTK